jgi:dolichol-phosphate mannosyltransferase
MPAEAAAASPPSPRGFISVAVQRDRESARLQAVRRRPASIPVIGVARPMAPAAGATASSSQRNFCVHRSGKLGLGTAIVAALQYGREHYYDYVLNMDADFSHHPRYIPAMLAAMDSADVAIGSRYCPGGGTKDWPFQRRFMSWAVNTYARWLLGLKPKDTSGGFRCYRVSLLTKLDLSTIKSRGYSFQEEILWRLKRVGARFVEVPIIFADRERGQSKINKQEALSALWIIFRLGATNWFGF